VVHFPATGPHRRDELPLDTHISAQEVTLSMPMRRKADVITITEDVAMRWRVLLLGTVLIGGCASWVDVHRTCQRDATLALQASGQLGPEVQQANYKTAYTQCVTAYGFADHLQADLR